MVHLKRDNKGRFIKGHGYWTGKKRPGFSTSTTFKKGEHLGENHPNWKGDDVGYHALHTWIIRNWGKANKCVNGHAWSKYEWANITGVYTRDRENWIEFCLPCHRKEDYHNPKGAFV